MLRSKVLGSLVAIVCAGCGPADYSDRTSESDEQISSTAQSLISRTFKQTDVQPDAVLEVGDRFGSVLATGDFNGDSFVDLVVTARKERGMNDTGWIGILYGNSRGLGSGRTEWFTHNSIVGVTRHAGDLLGFAAVAGDFDDDGDDDLAVSLPNYPTNGRANAGLVAIMNGSRDGLVPSNSSTLSLAQLTDQNANNGDRFGYALAVGRFDEDEFDDLAVGVPGKDFTGVRDAGAVFIYYGRRSGIDATKAENVSEKSVTGTAREQDAQFGAALAAGRFDGDQFSDLAVGTPAKKVNGKANSGMVAVLHGSSDGLFPTRSQILEQALLPNAAEENADHFGASLAVADFDGDTFDDLAIGAPLEDIGSTHVDSGAVGVVFGSSTGLLPESARFLDKQDSAARIGSEERFGARLATGDLDGDGLSDLVVGAPSDDIDNESSGALYVFDGDNTRTLRRSQIVSQKTFEGENQANANFGDAILAHDFDRDGLAELVVGAPNLDHESGDITDAGRLWLRNLQPVSKNFAGKAAIIIDRATGRTLASKSAHYRLHMASTTKIMTAVLAIEALRERRVALDTQVTISANAAQTGGSGIDLRAFDTMSFEDLLYSLMLPSTNSAAVAIAEHLDGDEPTWVARMNAKAAALNLADTHYANAHGRDPTNVDPTCTQVAFDSSRCAHYSTASDLAKLARTALQDELFSRIVSTKQHTVTSWRRAGLPVNQRMCNTNHTLPNPPGVTTNCPTHALEGVRAYGVKTGSTGRAGSCLVAAFQELTPRVPGTPRRNLITVVLGAADGDRFEQTENLINALLQPSR